MGEARVSDHTQIEGEEGYEARVGDGPVQAQQGKQWLEEEAQFGELEKQVATVLEGIEERESVRDG